MSKELRVSRVFNAPVELVWKTWTDQELLMQWWGPEHFTSPMAKVDLREGGKTLVCMRAPAEFGGQDMYSIWEYIKIKPFTLLEFIQNLSDKDGNKKMPSELGMPPDFPADVRTTVEFNDLGNSRTEMTVTEYADFGQMSHFAKLGLEQSLDKMGKIFKTNP